MAITFVKNITVTGSTKTIVIADGRVVEVSLSCGITIGTPANVKLAEGLYCISAINCFGCEKSKLPPEGGGCPGTLENRESL